MTVQPAERTLTGEDQKTLTWEDLGLDFDSIPSCECHPRVYTFRDHVVVGSKIVGPRCEEPADVIVTMHHVGTCRVKDQLLCIKHLKEYFLDRPGDTCRACGALKYISHRPL